MTVFIEILVTVYVFYHVTYKDMKGNKEFNIWLQTVLAAPKIL